jgi:uncharacterized protein YndB with AHSA1/START domain
MVRDYAAPPERVFDAWTKVEVLRTWFGCSRDTLWNVHVWDVRVGGKLFVSLDFDGKNPFEVRGEFLVVEPPHRLKYRWGDDEIVEVTIEPRESGSRLHLAHTFPEGKDARSIRTMGWTQSLAQLGEV